MSWSGMTYSKNKVFSVVCSHGGCPFATTGNGKTHAIDLAEEHIAYNDEKQGTFPNQNHKVVITKSLEVTGYL